MMDLIIMCWVGPACWQGAGGGQCGGGIVDEHSVCDGRGLAMLMLLRKQVVC